MQLLKRKEVRMFFFLLVHTKSLLETAMFVCLRNLNPPFIARACP